ncbi:hypothetical protein E3N88_33975 [Mikania micrantha]|uniref:RRM domain-containing protein n=1 Tax=Mikania micrantha TaxID=192012 RepID=A0A5N6MCY2_9ASTR|nr:hypothetical protein E3N88_33975 [Mikania micrantha]
MPLGFNNGQWVVQANYEGTLTIQWIQRSSDGRKVNNSRSSSKVETTFFVSNLPEGITEPKLREAFCHYGSLTDAYLARKRDKGGNLFGFIRFKFVKEVQKLLLDLSSVSLEGGKLGVNIAKYNKGGKKQEFPEDRKARVPEYNRQFNRDMLRSHKEQVSQSSYKDVLMGGKNEKIIHLPLTETRIPKWWKDYSLIGLAKDLVTLDNIPVILEEMGVIGGTIRFLSGLRVLITFPSPSFAKKFLVEKKEELSNCFSMIDLWTGQEYEFERIASIKVYGVPAQLWGSENFIPIGEAYGRLLQGPSASYNDCNLSYMKLIILTTKLNKIDDQVVISWRDCRFKIHVVEEDLDWAPSFLVSSSDLSINPEIPDRPVSHVPVRELNSRAVEEREDGEIFENNYEIPSSKRDGEGQMVGDDMSNLVDSRLVSPVGPEQTHPPPNLSPRCNNILSPFSMDSGPGNPRPKKRSRYEAGENVVPSNPLDLDIQISMDAFISAPDLNLPPPMLNSRPKRRYRNRPAATSFSLVDEDVSQPNGLKIKSKRQLVVKVISDFLMDFLSLNIRGHGNENKAEWIRSIKLSKKIHFMCIQETQLSDNSRLPLKLIWGNKPMDYDLVDANGRSGGLLSMWDPGIFSKLAVNKGDNFLHVSGFVMGVEEPFNIINVYAPHDRSLKRELWETLVDLVNSSYGMWIIMGDFNEVRSCSERHNSIFDHRGAREFNSFIFRARLHEYRMGGMKFTYASPDGTKFSKIFRILVCNNFLHRWPGAILTALPRKWSDHSPIALQSTLIDYGPTPFKFYTSWLKLPDLDDVVRKATDSASGVGPPEVILLENYVTLSLRLRNGEKIEN